MQGVPLEFIYNIEITESKDCFSYQYFGIQMALTNNCMKFFLKMVILILINHITV